MNHRDMDNQGIIWEFIRLCCVWNYYRVYMAFYTVCKVP
jgi:hypothetical protein